MPLVFTRGEPDERGRLLIGRVVRQPKLVSAESRRGGVDVDESQLVRPAIEPHQHATAWLTDSGAVEWDVHDLPDDDVRLLTKKLADAERHIDALIAVAESKSLLTRKEVEDEATRSREPVKSR